MANCGAPRIKKQINKFANRLLSRSLQASLEYLQTPPALAKGLACGAPSTILFAQSPAKLNIFRSSLPCESHEYACQRQ